MKDSAYRFLQGPFTLFLLVIFFALLCVLFASTREADCTACLGEYCTSSVSCMSGCHCVNNQCS